MQTKFDFHLGPAPTPVEGPLSGLRILVTRPALQAARTAARLAALGATPIVVPMQVIEPPGDPEPLAKARADLARFDAAIFVSPSAAEMVLAPFGASPLAWPSSVAVFAPGPGTAEALAACGIVEVAVPAERFDSEGLLALPALAEAQVRGRRIVLFRGERGRELLPATLAARGAEVTVVPAYRSRPPAGPHEGLASLAVAGGLDALSVMSAEALDHLHVTIAAFPPEASMRLRALPLYPSHPRIAEHARHLGFAEVIATEPGDAGLIAALLARHEA